MIFKLYRKKINNIQKEELNSLIHFFLTAINCSLEKENLNFILKNLILKLCELKNYEFIKDVIGDIEKLKELLIQFHEEKDFFYYFYIKSLSTHENFQEIIDTYIEINDDFKKSKYFNKINFKISKAYFKTGNFQKAIDIISKNKDIDSKLFLAHIYSIKNSKKELQIYNKINKNNLDIDKKAIIYLGYSEYFFKKNNIIACKKYLEKLKKIMPDTNLKSRATRFYKIGILSKKLNEEIESIFYLKRAANSKYFGEIELENKLKAISILLELEIITKEKAIYLINSNNLFYENDFVKKVIDEIINTK